MGKSPQNAIEQLGEFSSSLSLKNIPPLGVHEARRQLLDAFTSIVASLHYPGGMLPARAMRRLSSADSPGLATVLATGDQVTPPGAAFANVQASLAVDVASNLYYSQNLSGLSTFPALALAEAEHLSGSSLLEAIVAAYEVSGRLALSLPPNFYPPSMENARARKHHWLGFRWVGAGAVAGVSKMLGLDASQTAHALALATGSVPIPAGEPSSHFVQMSKYGVLGTMASNAIFCTFLAGEGFTGDLEILDSGDFHRALGGYVHDRGALTRGFGQDWLIHESNFKRFPSGTHNQPGLHTLEALIRQHALQAEDVSQVFVARAIGTSGAFAVQGPENYVQSQFSMPFQCAALLMGVPYRLWGSSYEDNAIGELSRRVTLELSPAAIEEFEAEWQNGEVRSAWWFRSFVRVITTDDRVLEKWSDYGRPTDEELKDKFGHFAQGLISAANVDSIVDMILHIDELEDVALLTQSLAAAISPRPVQP